MADAIRERQRELETPGEASRMGEACKGRLRRCRKVRVGRDHRMIYLVRSDDVVVLAVWYRRDLAAYAEAQRALREPLPTGFTP